MAKRLLVLTRYYYPAGGGAELATHLIVTRFLSKIYDEVLVVTGYPPLNTRRGRVEYRYWPLLRGRKPETVAKLFLHAGRLARLAKNYDTVYIPSNTLLFVPVLLRRKKYAGRIVVHLHDYQPVSYSSVLIYNTDPSAYIDYLIEKYDYNRGLLAIAVMPLTMLTRLYRAGLEYSDNIIVVSKRQAQLLLRYLRHSISTKIRVVYNPLPSSPKIKSYAKEKNSILYTGGEKFSKGFYVLIKMLAILARDSSSSWKVIITKASKRKTHAMHLLSSKYLKIRMFSRLPREELRSLYARSQVVVVPSVYEEPLPYSFVEPVLYGTLPVASNLGGISELVPPSLSHLLLAEPGNPLELVERIKAIVAMDDRDYREVVESMVENITIKMGDENVERYLRKIFS